MLILKRERGQHEASLFVTGRDIEQEQQLALTFDPSTALWKLVGNAEEYRRTKERQEILALLCEQGSDGMSPRQVAEALDKNYHTTRSLLRKMAEAGDIRQQNHQYVALTDDMSCQHRPSVALGKQEERAGPIKEEVPIYLDDTTEAAVTAGNSSSGAPSAGHGPPDGKGATSVQQDAGNGHPLQESDEIQQCPQQGMSESINPIPGHHCNQHPENHDMEGSPPEEIYQRQTTFPAAVSEAHLAEESSNTLLRKNHCPRHPHAQWVRFDPAGQAWCDKLDCWDCYRLMKIGEALEYRCLTDVGGRVVIAQGMAAWSAFVSMQRVFLVVVATEQAIALCRSQGIQVPDLSGEAQHLVEVDPDPP